MNIKQYRFKSDQSRHKEFAKLPKQVRQQAYKKVRDKIGRSEIVTVEAMLSEVANMSSGVLK